MPNTEFEPCIPTRGTKVPTGPDWIHEVKYDGYRMLVARKDTRVRLFSRNGHDWTERYPWIVEAALKNRQKHFVIDGEAVLLGVDGVSDFNGLHSIWRGSLHGGRKASSSHPSNRETSARTCSTRLAILDWRGW